MFETLKVKKLHEDAIIPKYQSKGAAGFDFYALEDTTIEPGQTTLVKTGLSFEVPLGHELQIRPRGGFSLKTKLRVANSPGTIDSDYRGEVKLILENIDLCREPNPYTKILAETIKIRKGDRIAQGVISEVIQPVIEETYELSETERGSRGFGSTGKN